jgi:hypothetical protein
MLAEHLNTGCRAGNSTNTKTKLGKGKNATATPHMCEIAAKCHQSTDEEES